MATITRFEEIEAWKSARILTKHVYQHSRQGRFAKDFGFRDQICRAAVSVMSNIAEGFESRTQALFINYLGQARASAGEVRSQLYVALDLDYISQESFDQMVIQAEITSGQTYKFISYLQSKPNTRRISENQILYEFPD